MANTSKILLLLAVLIAACDETPIQEISDQLSILNTYEQKMLGEWQYKTINVNGNPYDNATAQNTPKKYADPGFGERERLNRRWIYFAADGTYQLRWNRSNFELGSEGDPNWQPSFGYWQITDTGDTLIQNKGLPYETRYKLFIGDNNMSRSTSRYMSESFDGAWLVGDHVNFNENFVRKTD